MGDIVVNAYGKDFAYIDRLAMDKESKYCIYGCGVNGEIICRYLRNKGKDIEFFIDHQANVREYVVQNQKVISPNNFFRNKKDIKVLVSPDHPEPIVDFLLENGVERENIILPHKMVEKKICVLEEGYDINQYVDFHRQNEGTCRQAVATIYTIAYNTPKEMLCRTIESILNQTIKEFEYLFIDNGSTDETSDIVKKYAECDSRIKYVRLKKNVPWANRVLQETLRDHITTDYVAMVDSDDYYESDFLEKTIKIAKEDDSDIVQVNTLTYGHNGFRYSYFSHYMGKNCCVEKEIKEQYLLLRLINTPTWGKLYKSSLFKRLIDMMQSYEDDYERDRNFCLDISWVAYLTIASAKVSLCDELLHVRTWRPGSSEHSDDHGPKWLSSMVWSFNHLMEQEVSVSDREVYEDTALTWVFSLQREKYGLKYFREEDINHKAVQRFLDRPICDKYKY